MPASNAEHPSAGHGRHRVCRAAGSQRGGGYPWRVAEPRRIGRDGLPSLTSLRFFAALFVVLYHLVRQVGQVTDLSMLAWFGRSGVTFFFVLSGLVLAWTYADAMPRLRVFWWRRFARIWPLHVVATLLSVGVYMLLDRPVSTAGVVAALGLVHAWFNDPTIVNGGNGATWSLSDEAFFYLCFPLLLAVMARARDARRLALLVLAAVMAALFAVWVLVGASGAIPTTRGWALDYFPPTRLLQFAVGVAFGLALARGWRPRVQMRSAVLALVAYAILLLLWREAIPETSAWGPYSASQLFAVPMFLLAVLAAASRDMEGETGWLGSPWLIRLGHWSFAWYLVHEIVIRSLLALGGRPQGLAETAGVWLVALIVSQALAGLLYTLVEHPTERRLRALVGDGRPSQTEAAPTETPEPLAAR